MVLRWTHWMAISNDELPIRLERGEAILRQRIIDMSASWGMLFARYVVAEIRAGILIPDKPEENATTASYQQINIYHRICLIFPLVYWKSRVSPVLRGLQQSHYLSTSPTMCWIVSPCLQKYRKPFDFSGGLAELKISKGLLQCFTSLKTVLNYG